MQRDLADPRFHSCTPSHMRVPMVANESIEEQNSRTNYEAECDVVGELPVRMPPAHAPVPVTPVTVLHVAVTNYVRRRSFRSLHWLEVGTEPAFYF